MSRLYDHYKNEVVDELMKQFNYTSVMQVPRLEK
ncbi:MAG: 50S ribosomal protein L5, partial [Clostridiaceae bacterium]|nr:50S ribosomal protein L5 [Clostridiaceae bacterium]